jgi:hypothetical protein
MESVDYVGYGWVAVITAIVCGKWAMELGLRQSRQLLWMIAGLVIPPLVLLALYVRLIRQLKREGEPGGRW